MPFLNNIRKKSQEYGVPIWKLPEFLLLISALVNIIIMLATYYWAEDIANDPREAVILVALEAIAILTISNMIVESAEGIIRNQKLKKEFIDIISHQARTPLTNIRWSLEMIERKKSRGVKAIDSYFNRIAESSEKIATLINDFINLSRLEENGEFEKKEVSLVDILKEVIRGNDFFSKAKNVKVIFPRTTKFIIKTNPEGIRIVFENLVDNAIKYAPDDTTVNIDLKKQNDCVIFKITNAGEGIGIEEKPFIFEKFYRAEGAKLMFTHGTGLGLFISKNLLKKINGEIWFKSIPKEKTTFFVKLPTR